RCLEGHFLVAFAPDGKTMASRAAWNEKVIRVLNVATGKEIGQFMGSDRQGGKDFCFSPDGGYIVVGGGTPNRRSEDPPSAYGKWQRAKRSVSSLSESA